MISDQVVVLVESGESETLKFTETTVKRRKAARTVCASPNRTGFYPIFPQDLKSERQAVP